VRPDGRPALTLYSVVRRLPAHTLLRVRPMTGRTHQIRVHLAAAGHPVWGDLLYKDESLFLRYWEAGRTIQPGMPPRHLLHAERAAFRHPVTGSEVVIVSPPPPDFTAILGGLE
jgi:23S rRNA pseudouridine1911/1915/1917 synthase